MKMHVYLSVVCSVLLLGFVMTYFRDKEKLNVLAAYVDPQSQQRYQELARQLAVKTCAEPISEWVVYGGQADAIIVDGIDSKGEQIIKCVFDTVTGRPLSVLRQLDDTSGRLSDAPTDEMRDRAVWWLKRISTTEGSWHWVRDGELINNRYLSYWQSANSVAALSVNTRTGQLIALRLNRRNSISAHSGGTNGNGGSQYPTSTASYQNASPLPSRKNPWLLDQ